MAIGDDRPLKAWVTSLKAVSLKLPTVKEGIKVDGVESLAVISHQLQQLVEISARMLILLEEIERNTPTLS